MIYPGSLYEYRNYWIAVGLYSCNDQVNLHEIAYFYYAGSSKFSMTATASAVDVLG